MTQTRSCSARMRSAATSMLRRTRDEFDAVNDVVKIDRMGTGDVSFTAGYAGNVDAWVTGDFDGVAENRDASHGLRRRR